MLCSNNLQEYIIKAGILKYIEGFESDHRGIFCDLDPKLFINTTNQI
jgi:hypothetical protein